MSVMQPEDYQHAYYARTAHEYNTRHLSPDDEHQAALGYISAFATERGLETILDVGAGTGRSVAYLRLRHPNAGIMGVEPVAELIAEAAEAGIPDGVIVQGQGQSLPFPNGSFDAVCESAVLHHVKRPEEVVSEMMRVARKAIFLSDSNRFGQGSMPARLVKLAAYQMRLWPCLNFLKTRGKGYTLSEGDGLSYSYSVYDSLDQLSAWADTIVIVPTQRGAAVSRLGPLLVSGTVLLCAFKE